MNRNIIVILYFKSKYGVFTGKVCIISSLIRKSSFKDDFSGTFFYTHILLRLSRHMSDFMKKRNITQITHFSHISIWIRWETRGTTDQIQCSVQVQGFIEDWILFFYIELWIYIWQQSCDQGKVHRGIHAEVDEAEAGEMGQTGENLPLHISSKILGRLFITFIFLEGDLWRTASSPGIVPRPR